MRSPSSSMTWASIVARARRTARDDRRRRRSPARLPPGALGPSRTSLAVPSLQYVTAMRSPSGAIETHIGHPSTRQDSPSGSPVSGSASWIRPSAVTAMSLAPSGRRPERNTFQIGFPHLLPGVRIDDAEHLVRGGTREHAVARAASRCRSPARRTDTSPRLSPCPRRRHVHPRICCRATPSGPTRGAVRIGGVLERVRPDHHAAGSDESTADASASMLHREMTGWLALMVVSAVPSSLTSIVPTCPFTGPISSCGIARRRRDRRR